MIQDPPDGAISLRSGKEASRQYEGSSGGLLSSDQSVMRRPMLMYRS